MLRRLLKWSITPTLLFVYHTSASSLTRATSTSDAIPFSPGFDVEAVLALATTLPSHSWEFGTASEALLELFDAPHAVFGANPFPVPTIQPSDSPSLTYAKENIVISTPPDGLSNGDGAVGDPASLGVSAVLLGKTLASYSEAAAQEAFYVINEAPKWPNGAISHRAQYAELWADFVYMAPPFLAYYGVATNNVTTLRIAVEQCQLYRQALTANTTIGSAVPPTTHSSSTEGLWIHILGPASPDPGLWSTGNAWAAAGTMRVLATLVKAPSSLFSHGSSSLPNEAWRAQAIVSLVQLISAILDGAIRQQRDQGLLRNYLDDPSWFGETSGSTLLASVAYRISALSLSHGPLSASLASVNVHSYITFAESIRRTLGSDGHISSNGTATPAINPLNWGDHTPFTAGSPEGQNFVILLYAAWRDCVRAGVPGCSAH
ncbi:hypothetical protein CPB84DRAFT_1813300 [Gymnopilus junonius]|uniref:Uncharacterized protein n=1 Tax=Gymnopilus junonius TaxID=109634 RepID=A0A9P5TSC8_GYMJU|nr:hypothetical protein CPB84DRAFT_1813300 [Gymnopilus junonius]